MGYSGITPEILYNRSTRDWSGIQRDIQKENMQRQAVTTTIDLTRNDYDIVESDFSVTEGNWKPYSGWNGWEP